MVTVQTSGRPSTLADYLSNRLMYTHLYISGSFSYKIEIIAYDYAGYGISPHQPTEEMTYQDLETVLSYVVTVLRYDLSEIYLWGFSLGTGPTVEIAKKYSTLCGVILNSPLASCLAWLDKTSEKPLGGYTGTDSFSNITKISQIKSKILIMHGERDRVVPCCHSRSLFEKLRTERVSEANDDAGSEWLFTLPGADHNDIPALFADPESDLSAKVKKIMEFMYLDKRIAWKEAKGLPKNKFVEESLLLKKLFADIRINDVGTCRKIIAKNSFQ